MTLHENLNDHQNHLSRSNDTHNCIEADEFFMPEHLHDFCLLQEGLWRHGPWLESLYGNLCGTVPYSYCVTTYTF